MVLNATFNNISVISWRSVLLVEETGISWENHRTCRNYMCMIFWDIYITGSGCGRVVKGAGRKAKRMVLQCINGVSSNPVEGRAKICQLTDLILTLFGLIFRRIYQMAMVFSLLNNLLSFLYHGQDVYSTCLWVTRRIFYPSRTPKLTPCFTIENTWVNPVFYPSRIHELTPCFTHREHLS